MGSKIEKETTNPISELSKEDVISKNNSLIRLHANLEAELNEKLQQIHDYKRELIRHKTLKIEYINEIESIQVQGASECEKLKLKVENLEKQKYELNCKHTEQLKDFEQNIFKKDEEISKLQNEFDSISNVSTSNNKENDIHELNLDNAKCKDVVEKLQSEIVTLKDKIDILEKQHLMDKAQNNNVQEGLNMLHENYKNEKEKLEEVQQLNETLQEDIILARQELETVKSKPLQDGSQGNSLFAEVDNKRLELEDRMTIMKSQYLKMKNEYGKLISKVTTLTSKNAELCKKWETKLQYYDNTIEEKYREQIKLLKSEFEVYIEKILSRQIIPHENLEPGEIHFMENMLQAKNNEIVTTLKQGDSFSLSRIMLSCQLRDSNMEMRSCRAKATKLECEIAKLQAEIEDQELKNNSKKETVLIAPKSSLTSSKNKKSILKSKNVDNMIARLSTADDGFSMIDYSRLIKRSRSREQSDIKSKGVEYIACDSKENVETQEDVKPLIDISKNIGLANDIVEYSDTAKSKSKKVLKKKC